MTTQTAFSNLPPALIAEPGASYHTRSRHWQGIPGIAREILMATFTEADVLADKDVSGRMELRAVVSALRESG